MEAYVNRYIESLEREMASGTGIALPTRSDIAPYLVEPFDTTCSQGAFRYTARALAQRQDKVFFIAYDTQQYGVGFWDAAGGGCVAGADQYLTPEAAIRSFLVDEPKS